MYRMALLTEAFRGAVLCVFVQRELTEIEAIARTNQAVLEGA